MLKKYLVLMCVLTLVGCTYGQEYLENPETILRDPHFTGYKQKRDDLEREYLHKDITYAEYIEKRDHLDNTYAREVQERNAKIMSPE